MQIMLTTGVSKKTRIEEYSPACTKTSKIQHFEHSPDNNPFLYGFCKFDVRVVVFCFLTRVFSQTQNIGSNDNIGIRRFTM